MGLNRCFGLDLGVDMVLFVGFDVRVRVGPFPLIFLFPISGINGTGE